MDLKKVIEYADELGERFPDMKDSEIVFSCSEFAGKEFTYWEQHVVIVAYDHDAEVATQEARKLNLL